MTTKTAIFSRYANAPEDNDIQMPRDMLDARVSNESVGELLARLEDYSKDPAAAQAMYPWATRFVMGYPLPSFQRPQVWTQEQKVRFILSLWCGVDVGSYLINGCYEYVAREDKQLVTREFSEVLLDGQQRLSTIEAYVTDGFGVPDANGDLRFWSDLPMIERRRFSLLKFARATISTWDEDLMRKAYDLRAFGGTPHKESERASRTA